MGVASVQTSPVNMEDRKRIGIRAGDTVRVWQKVTESDGKIRLQSFEGVVLATRHGTEPGATFTVRRTSDPYGTEKIFPLYSPMIDKIEIVKRAKVRRAKLYHIRERAAREIKRQMRNLRFVDISTESDTQAIAEREAGTDADDSKQTDKDAAEEKKETVEKKKEEVLEKKEEK